MTDRIFALTVHLENSVRDDDCEFLVNAIRAMRNVENVEMHVETPEIMSISNRRKDIQLGIKIMDAGKSIWKGDSSADDLINAIKKVVDK